MERELTNTSKVPKHRIALSPIKTWVRVTIFLHDITPFSRPALRARARIVVGQIRAGRGVHARVAEAFVDVGLQKKTESDSVYFGNIF